MSIAFTTIHLEMQINSMSIMHKGLPLEVIDNYKCFWMCVYHTNNYQSSLLTLHIRLVRMLITRRISKVVY